MTNGAFADQALEKKLKRSPMSAQDRALVTELVNGTLRWHGQLEWILGQLFKGDYGTCPPKLKTILEITLYQLRFLDR
ncbi:16S rRNA (cytosine(967)-C(5))-methyltransferase RsmB, partial [bacterium]|nr:16S rRNA (cytosine(967)-C(5))-methyltransferase RsmB [bacterium]